MHDAMTPRRAEEDTLSSFQHETAGGSVTIVIICVDHSPELKTVFDTPRHEDGASPTRAIESEGRHHQENDESVMRRSSGEYYKISCWDGYEYKRDPVNRTACGKTSERPKRTQSTRTAETLVQKMLFATKVHVGDAIDSKDIDPLMASLANSMDSISSEYGMLATRLELSSIYREAEPSFSSAMETAKLNGRISAALWKLDRDNYFTYSALRSLREKYLLQKGCVLIERPQYLWLRVALQMHLSDMEVFGDREGLFSSMERAAKCFYTGGSIGVGLQSVPLKRSSTFTSVFIYKANATAFRRSEQHTMRPVLELFEAATALYLETLARRCSNVLTQVPATSLQTKKDRKAQFTGLMVNDFFMQKVEMDGLWTMFCPSDAYRLITSHGPEFEQEYLRLENGGFGKLTVKARVLWDEIMETQVKFGGPVILFKEASN
ncbi:ribonucleotide reductase, partial [Ephemerocybe angulata]